MQRGKLKKSKGIFIMAVAFCLGVLLTVGCDRPGLTPTPTPTPPGQSGCPGTNMLDLPAHLDELGPYPVAARYVYIKNPRVTANNLMFRRQPFRVQIFYPTTQAAVAGMEKKLLDMEDMKFYIPDIKPISGVVPPTLPTDYYELPDEKIDGNDREATNFLPMDTDHGPYPVIFLVHGTSSSSVCHYTMATHWASRGFVVLAADYNGINMRDMLKNFMAFESHQELPDTRFLVEQVKLQNQSQNDNYRENVGNGVFSMLKGHIDTNRMGIAGHSWGGQVTCDMSGTPGIKVAIPLASVGVRDDTEIESALIMGGQKDGVLNYRIDTVAGYNATKARKRMVGLPSCGHEAFVDLCDIILLADAYNVYLDPMIKGMATDGCNEPDDPNPSYMDEELSMDIIKYATAGAFEETLQCSADAGAQLDNIENYFNDDIRNDLGAGQQLDYRSSGATPDNRRRMPFVTDGLEMVNIIFSE